MAEDAASNLSLITSSLYPPYPVWMQNEIKTRAFHFSLWFLNDLSKRPPEILEKMAKQSNEITRHLLKLIILIFLYQAPNYKLLR